MNKKNYWDRFKHFKKSTWILIGFMAVIEIVGLYFSISMSVKLSQGLTLFGNPGSFDSSVVETTGPTSADLQVLSFYWILTGLLLLLLLFYLFIRKEDTSIPAKKEIVNGKTVIVKDMDTEKKENKHDSK